MQIKSPHLFLANDSGHGWSIGYRQSDGSDHIVASLDDLAKLLRLSPGLGSMVPNEIADTWLGEVDVLVSGSYRCGLISLDEWRETQAALGEARRSHQFGSIPA